MSWSIPAIRRALTLASACVLLFVAQSHGGTRLLSADFDGDGRGDRVSFDARDPLIVRVWLSTTRSTHILRSTEPVRAVTALDLNGDRRPELIASSHAPGLQVWTKTGGGFRAFRRKQPPPTRQMGRSGRHTVDDDEDGPPATDAGAMPSPAPATAQLHALLSVPSIRVHGSDPSRSVAAVAAIAPFAPRPPPVPAI